MTPEKETTQNAVSVQALLEMGGPNLVYIRAVSADEMSDIPGMNAEAPITLYSVHAADGTRLAVVNDRDAAFVAARQNEREPVSVH